MVRERNGWKRAVSLLLALCIAATLTVFTPAYAADTSWKKIDTIETAKGKNGEYMQVKTPLNTANTLMVSGKVPSATKMVLITVKGVADNQYYVRTFVKPASDGSFSVTIKTGVGTTATPKARSPFRQSSQRGLSGIQKHRTVYTTEGIAATPSIQRQASGPIPASKAFDT